MSLVQLAGDEVEMMHQAMRFSLRQLGRRATLGESGRPPETDKPGAAELFGQ